MARVVAMSMATAMARVVVVATAMVVGYGNFARKSRNVGTSGKSGISWLGLGF